MIDHMVIMTNKMLKEWRVLLGCIMLSVSVMSATTYICSQYCKMTGCNGFTGSDCSGCNTNWLAVGSSCMIDPSSNRMIVDSSTDTGGSIVLNNTLTTTTCTNINLVTQVFGDYTASTDLKFTLTQGVNIPHYSLQVYYNIIMIDTNGGNGWDVGGGGKQFTLALTGGSSANTNMNSGSKVQSNGFCGSGSKKDIALYCFSTYAHNALNVPLQFILTNTNSKNNALFAFKEMIVVAVLCYPGCLVCTASLNSTCSSCDPLASMMLSGTTCATYCLAGYGPTADPTVCILCSQYCVNCSMSATLCTVCYTTGTNASYLYDNGTGSPSCVLTCPNGYFKNNTLMTCDLCDADCVTCINSSSTCLSCLSPSGWLNYTCNVECPAGYFLSCNGGAMCGVSYTNCSRCNNKCLNCSINSTYCTMCTMTAPNIAYLYNNTQCVTNCPNNTYAQDYGLVGPNTCIACDISCQVCSAAPSPCTVCNNNYYLYDQVCSPTCPTGYFPKPVINQCLLCSLACVNLTIHMYFSSPLNAAMIIDMKFTNAVNFPTLNYQAFQSISISPSTYTLSMFTVAYSIVNTTCYRITLTPIGYIFLYNATFTVTTAAQPFPINTAIDSTPFMDSVYGMSNSLQWMVVLAPTMSAIQTSIISSLSAVNDQVSTVTTLPFIQELKKAGLFCMLFSGAQATSTSVLVNSVPSQNLYEAARFWAMFVFFDAPPWEKNSNKAAQQRIIVPSQQQIVANARLLFDISTVKWRFNRTGQTSFFIFDVYIPILLISTCWILLYIGKRCLKEGQRQSIAPRFYAIMHKIHEITIFYISLATLLQWLYFDATSLERWVSFLICLITNFYFFGYELYIYYDMLEYPSAQIGNEKYAYYVERYSSFLKRIRYQEYKMSDKWSPRHWFRPYNYHILSYYKKFLMMIALPLFYDTQHTQIIVLIIIQLMEMVRFIAIRPFVSKWRNVYRTILEITLFLFFCTVAAQSWLVAAIMLNDPATLSSTINQYFIVGWIAFVLVFFYNLSFLAIMIIDIVIGCKYTNQQLMDEARRLYYFNRLNQYEEENTKAPLGVLNQYVKLGNLNKRVVKELPSINLRIEYYSIVKSGLMFEVTVKKVKTIFMNIEFNFQGENNVSIEGNIDKVIKLRKEMSPKIYDMVDKIFEEYGKNKDVESITIKTFLRIDQKQHSPGDKIPMKVENMSQRIEIQVEGGQIQVNKLEALLPGFPLNAADLSDL